MKAKSFFLIFIGMAVVPLALAFMMLKFEWYTPGATNKGQFVQADINVALEHEKPTWSFVYQPSLAHCDSQCEEQVYGLNQTYIALGKHQKDVKAYVLHPSYELAPESRISVAHKVNEQLSSQFLYLVDPFGKVILQYPVGANREQTIQMSKDMLADVKKLLKYARVG